MHTAEIDIGMKVRDTNGESVGKVIAVGANTFLIEKGLFFPKDYTVRMSQVREIRDGEIWLDQPRDALERTTSEDMAEAEEARAPIPPGAEPGVVEPPAPEPASARSMEEARVPLAEEEVRVAKHSEQTGEVVVHKEQQVEEQQLTVPVTREQVHVERVPASGEPARGEETFEEGTVSVPIHEEKVTVSKEPVVREEVRVEKTAEPDEERIATERRKEVAEVEERGEAEARPSRPSYPGAERPSHP